MSEPVIPGLTPEPSRSSVKISTTAKGEALVEVKGYTNDFEQLDACREKVVETYRATRSSVAETAMLA